MLSYARGPEEEILEKTIGQAVDDAAGRFPDSDALVSRHQQLRLTWEQLRAEVVRTARGLWGIGVRPGDRIGMWSTNCVEWFYLQAAAARLGAILVNVNPAYRAHDLRYVLKCSRMKTLFLHEQDFRVNYLDVLGEARHGEDLALRDVVVLDGESWHDMLERGAEPPPLEVSQNDVVNIQYTSGTTGCPKGVLLTHRNLLNNGYFIGRRLKAKRQDRICLPVPLYHCFGCVIGEMVALTSGAALVLPSPQFDALATLEAAQAERCTAIYGVPTMFIAEFEHPRFAEFDFSTMRTGVMAGSPCPIELMRRVVNEMHCGELTICYGQTECSPVITMSATDDTVETRVATVGRALPNTEVKIVDPATGQTLEHGEQGELCARGYLVMRGYDECKDNTIDAEGWLHTGDLATMREDGCFRITGRAKDMISRGGEKIYPREVEEFLHRHPKIADAYVFSIPDERLGERVAAWVQLKKGAAADVEEIRGFCKDQIAYFKIPEFVRFVESFPMTANGKVQKYLMREREIRERGLEAVAAKTISA
ncbi:MAG: AMP-binding protein [Acidobacteriota bacterium]